MASDATAFSMLETTSVPAVDTCRSGVPLWPFLAKEKPSRSNLLTIPCRSTLWGAHRPVAASWAQSYRHSPAPCSPRWLYQSTRGPKLSPQAAYNPHQSALSQSWLPFETKSQKKQCVFRAGGSILPLTTKKPSGNITNSPSNWKNIYMKKHPLISLVLPTVHHHCTKIPTFFNLIYVLFCLPLPITKFTNKVLQKSQSSSYFSHNHHCDETTHRADNIKRKTVQEIFPQG